MDGWLFLLPLIAACMGWVFVSLALRFLFHPVFPKFFLGFTYQGLIPKRQAEWALKAGRFGASLFSLSEIAEKITQPDNVKKIMPQAEAHIDSFLRVKLVKSMPVVGMFVGDKTINNLKSLFVTELEQLFPEIMKSYMDRLQEDFDIEQIIAAKLAAYPPAAIEEVFFQTMKKELVTVKFTAALLGFITGLLQWLLLLLILH